ncbi:GGDEF domain-containing protein [Cohnella faecalis]|uniref:GGDEF domain-containing protein n=3 Tax=Cohnella faecalis TaxID=2315694 RepID=A0A398CIG8_9BACL|nr:GGDEF domain-containing protein [Cohnella faecalis]
MLFMSFRLYARNRRAAFRSLLVSLGFILVHHSLQLALSVGLVPVSTILAFVGKLLQVFAFIVINFAVFELYHKKRSRTKLWFYGLLVFGVMIAIAGLLPGSSSQDYTLEAAMSRTPALDGYLLVLSPLFALMLAPHVGQRFKYAASLIVAFAAQLSEIAIGYWEPDSAALDTLSGLLPVFYYVLLFMVLFERVVELLQTAYRSSITDGLTNLYNRRFFSGQLDRALRSGKPVGVIFCDIDNFKRLNDTQGHHKADGVLKQVAAILMEETDGIGLSGRYGGEELVAFVNGPTQTVFQTAESIRLRTEKESIVTISVGFSLSDPDDSTVPGYGETLLKQADQAMYHSKTSGKNRVTDYATISSRTGQSLIASPSGGKGVRK